MADEITKKINVVKKEPGTYDHTESHTAVYSLMNVGAADTPIDRAWARLHDRNWDAGPAVSKPFIQNGVEIQYFLYAKATRELKESNVNNTVDFSFGGGIFHMDESGL